MHTAEEVRFGGYLDRDTFVSSLGIYIAISK